MIKMTVNTLFLLCIYFTPTRLIGVICGCSVVTVVTAADIVIVLYCKIGGEHLK
jgi:hypothetical protein